MSRRRARAVPSCSSSSSSSALLEPLAEACSTNMVTVSRPGSKMSTTSRMTVLRSGNGRSLCCCCCGWLDAAGVETVGKVMLVSNEAYE
jgi:hypothetical protein